MVERLRESISKVASSKDRTGMLYKSLFEDSHSVMFVIHPGTGRIIDANAAACNFYQYPKNQIVFMNITDINIHPPAQIFEEMENARLEKRNHFNFQHRLANGEIRDVEVYCSPVVIDDQKILFSVVHDISERKKHEREREELILKLENALSEIKTLKGILPICASCKKIRDDEGYWKQIESYISEHSEAEFSHGICPECARKLYPEAFDED